MGDIDVKTNENELNSQKVNELVSKVNRDAKQSNIEMNKMLTAMAQINESAVNISKIIKVIEDIVFQTNLLALTATVEAARAGRHGKGFSVVVEEVRSLAARSQTAAKETSEQINQSTARTDEGARIANSTADSITRIVSEISNVSDNVRLIAGASAYQPKAVSHVMVQITEIANVTATNAAIAVDVSSTAHEFSDTSSKINDMIIKFRLKEA